MRFNITSGFSEVFDAHQKAYAAFDIFATAGDDGTKYGGSAAADEASDLEQATLDALLAYPCSTPIEMADKMKWMRQRGPFAEENLIWTGAPEAVDRMQLELITMSRPNVSARFAEAFAEFAAAQRHHWSESSIEDDEMTRRREAVEATIETILALPCTTPGDFIVKQYLRLIEGYGSYTDPIIHEFLPDMVGSDQRFPDRHDKIAFDDIVESDLGRCMMALGTTDFDAEAWIAQAARVGKIVQVYIQSDGKRGLSFGMLSNERGEGIIGDMLQCLMAGGPRDLSTARCHALADAIEANHPNLLVDFRKAVELPAKEAEQAA